MVLERLFKTRDLLQSNYLMFAYALIIVFFSLATAVIFFTKSASILLIAFVTIAFTHLMYNIYFITEKDIEREQHTMMERYGLIIRTYFKIFMALVVVFTLCFLILPESYKVMVFEEQIHTINNVAGLRDQILANAGNFLVTLVDIGYKGNSLDVMFYIFLNNLEVLVVAILLSFLYGAGAIFLIAYQASILGAIIGQNIVSLFSVYNHLGIYGQIFAIFQGSYLSLGFIPHGVFEFMAYFLGAIAGGIISASFFGHYSITRRATIITIKDVLILILSAVICLLVGAMIESYLLTM